MRGKGKREKRYMLGDNFERKWHIKKGRQSHLPSSPPPHTIDFHRSNLKGAQV
jgi:hypothetical protein